MQMLEKVVEANTRESKEGAWLHRGQAAGGREPQVREGAVQARIVCGRLILLMATSPNTFLRVLEMIAEGR